MRTLLVLVVLALTGTALAEPSGREKALARIDALLEADDLEQAEKLLAFLLEKNPGDAGLLERQERLRIRQGRLGDLLAGGDALAKPDRRSDLRAACWRVVEAAASGSPDELEGLAKAGDPDRAKKVLRPLIDEGLEPRLALASLGDEAARSSLRTLVEENRPDAVAFQRSARRLVELEDEGVDARLAKLAADGTLEALIPLPDASLAPHESRILVALKREPGPVVCDLAGRLGSDRARPILRPLVRKGPPETAIAAAGALLALGDRSARPVLEKIMAEGKPAQVTAALTHLAAHPGKGGRVALLERMATNPPVPRIRAICCEIVMTAMGRGGDADVRPALEARLKDPDTAAAAARALGELGDDAAVEAVLAFLREPPKDEDSEASAASGLGYIGRRMGGTATERAIALQPRLVAAIAILRMTATE